MASAPEHVSVTEAARRGVARLVADAAHGDEVVVERHGVPVAAVVGTGRLAELESLRDDVRDLALALARLADDDGGRVSLGEALLAFRPGAAGEPAERAGRTESEPRDTP
jgi:antitoxin (DNA-binding transcriptional repressor) of toxin-antitoxin stability system